MTRQLLESPSNTVISTARNPAKATDLKALADTAKGTLHVVQLEIADYDSIRKCADEVKQILGDRGIDYLVNNAAIVRPLLSPRGPAPRWSFVPVHD